MENHNEIIITCFFIVGGLILLGSIFNLTVPPFVKWLIKWQKENN